MGARFIDGWMDGVMDDRMDGWMTGQMSGYLKDGREPEENTRMRHLIKIIESTSSTR